MATRCSIATRSPITVTMRDMRGSNSTPAAANGAARGGRPPWNGRAKVLILLHVLLLIYSLSGIFSKTAAAQPFLSLQFIGLYGGMLLILFVYAIGWQQIIKRMPLTLAFMNKAVTIVWGVLWGFLLFDERITVGKVIGALLVIAGVMLFAKADGEAGDADFVGAADAQKGIREESVSRL